MTDDQQTDLSASNLFYCTIEQILLVHHQSLMAPATLSAHFQQSNLKPEILLLGLSTNSSKLTLPCIDQQFTSKKYQKPTRQVCLFVLDILHVWQSQSIIRKILILYNLVQEILIDYLKCVCHSTVDAFCRLDVCNMCSFKDSSSSSSSSIPHFWKRIMWVAFEIQGAWCVQWPASEWTK